MEVKPDISIKETREVIKAIHEVYGYDFSEYALTSFMRGLNRIMFSHNMLSSSEFIRSVKHDHVFFDKFLRELSVEETEMFRDPSLWRFLIKEIIPAEVKQKKAFKIWLPHCITGEELYSLLIVLKEEEVLNKSNVLVGTNNTISVDSIKNGIVKKSKLKLSEENYTRVHGKKETLQTYYAVKDAFAVINSDLFSNVTVYKSHINLEDAPEDVDLILFRNVMLYYNMALKDKKLNLLFEKLKEGGLLIIGAKETLEGHNIAQQFVFYTPLESIYMKKTKKSHA
jgi:chemotaxis protein methyltransferase CheR